MTVQTDCWPRECPSASGGNAVQKYAVASACRETTPRARETAAVPAGRALCPELRSFVLRRNQLSRKDSSAIIADDLSEVSTLMPHFGAVAAFVIVCLVTVIVSRLRLDQEET